jgi:hypothetical protein
LSSTGLPQQQQHGSGPDAVGVPPASQQLLHAYHALMECCKHISILYVPCY